MKHMLWITLCLLGATGAKAARVDTLEVFSNAMKKAYKCVVIVPDSYAKDRRQHYPVVYLLHGYSDSYDGWIKKVPAVARLADTYQLMIVCPDGGFSSWYWDSPLDSSRRFETYVGTEIPAYIDAHYRTRPRRQYRAITGLSMGGHGALFLAIRHQQTFGAAGSMSGGVDIRPFPKNWDMAQRIGPIEQYPDNWYGYSVMGQLPRLQNKSLALTIECGVKDFFIGVNRQLHDRLLELGIAHDYAERPGEHTWQYWANAVEYQLLFFSKFFAAADNKNTQKP